MSTPGTALEHIFPGPSELSKLMRGHDWSSTSLGPPEGWPQGLRVPLGMMLTSRFEMWLGWGPDIAFFYNDAYVPTLGIKHPDALGQPMRVVWKEVFAAVEDRIRSVMIDGVATWDKALLLLLERNGYPEETYHTFSYSPLRGDSGAVEGLMCVVSEETERVISERRLTTLRMLADGLNGIQVRDEAMAAVRATLAANRKDFPFALIFLHDTQGQWVGQPATPDAVSLIGHDWPLAAIDDGDTGIRVDIRDIAAAVPLGAWEARATQALLVPIAQVGSKPLGAMVLGLNPHRPDDNDQ
ncbi:MAG: hypothetical protein NT113_19210 [Hyphomicrobiales bacterium]|nr:hypothetical protein [Hyphomicrobiales bacterium]